MARTEPLFTSTPPISPTTLHYARPADPRGDVGRRRTIAAITLTLGSGACEVFVLLGWSKNVVALMPMLLTALAALLCGAGGFVFSILALRAAGARAVPILALVASTLCTGVALFAAAMAAMFTGWHGC